MSTRASEARPATLFGKVELDRRGRRDRPGRRHLLEGRPRPERRHDREGIGRAAERLRSLVLAGRGAHRLATAGMERRRRNLARGRDRTGPQARGGRSLGGDLESLRVEAGFRIRNVSGGFGGTWWNRADSRTGCERPRPWRGFRRRSARAPSNAVRRRRRVRARPETNRARFVSDLRDTEGVPCASRRGRPRRSECGVDHERSSVSAEPAWARARARARRH
jgi:hypothetical protein